jgi:scyllo-inositol 2-dehydrogenase (NADP+)
MVRVALVGLGKMGLSHLAILRMHPHVELVAICESNKLVAELVANYLAIKSFVNIDEMFSTVQIDAIVVATPTKSHSSIVQTAVQKKVHVFCEKPFCINTNDGRQIIKSAKENKLITQVGYHLRFIATFRRLRELIKNGSLGEISHVRIEAYGPVVLRQSKATWRSTKTTGGGCLYDYASHAIDLSQYLVGPASAVYGSRIKGIFSQDVDDEVHTTLEVSKKLSAQIDVNWSDSSMRKMSVQASVWGNKGKAVADRQEIKFFSNANSCDIKTKTGWNRENITDLTPPVSYYLRGEEYTEQISNFVHRINSLADDLANSDSNFCSTFESAHRVDVLAEMIRKDAIQACNTPVEETAPLPPPMSPIKLWLRSFSAK